jgi:1,4-alpha-glucan branching enzyme
VLDLMLEQDKIGLIAPSTYLRQFRPRQGMLPKQGSWGLDGLHVNWQHPRLVPLQQAMLETEERLAALVVEHAQAKGIQERILNQALRELLLAQSSDWLLLGSQGSDEDPLVRPSMHLRRCHELCDLVAQEPLEDGHILLLEQYEEEDNPFPAINFRMFVRM